MKYITLLLLLISSISYGQKQHTREISSVRFASISVFHKKPRLNKLDTIPQVLTLTHKLGNEPKFRIHGYMVLGNGRRKYLDCEYRKLPMYYAVKARNH